MERLTSKTPGERSLAYWRIESPTYNFSVSLSSSLSQLVGIRFLGMDIALLGVLVVLQLAAVGVGALAGIALINNYRHRRKSLWLLFGAANRIGWSLLIVTAMIPQGVGVLVFYSIVVISQISGAIAGIAAMDVGGDLVRRDRAAGFFGSLSSLNNLAALASLVTSVAVFVILGSGSFEAYLALYLLSLASAVTSTVFLIMIKDDPDVVNSLRQARRPFSMASQVKLYRELLASREARWYIAIVVLYTASVNIPASLWNYYLIYSIGGDEVWITSKAATTYLVKALMLGVWPLLIRGLDVRNIFTVSLILISPIPTMFMMARSFSSQIALEVYSAIWWSAWDLLTGLYNLYLLPRELRPAALSLITLTTNVSASISSAIGSLVSTYVAHGPEITFTASTMTRLLVAFIAVKKLPKLDLKV